MRVLVADDDLFCRDLLAEVLRGYGHECVAVDDGAAAWRQLMAYGADVVISDWQMPGLTGLELCNRVRTHPEISYPYFILLTARDDRIDVLTALRAGVDDHLAKPLDMDQLEARLIVAERVRALHLEILQTRQALEAANVRLDGAAHRDSLTGLGNRLRLEEELADIHARFVRAGHVYNIALFDVDHFKEYNDTYGHQAGDAVLAEVGHVLASEMRRGDLAFRYGGEEFLVMLPNWTLEEAAKGADRLRRLVVAATGLGRLPAASMSAGVVQAAFGETVEQVIGRADRAMYRAKDAGRNRVIFDDGLALATV